MAVSGELTTMLTVSDRIQIPSKTTHKDKGTNVNTFHYFISKYSVHVPCGTCSLRDVAKEKLSRLLTLETPRSKYEFLFVAPIHFKAVL